LLKGLDRKNSGCRSRVADLPDGLNWLCSPEIIGGTMLAQAVWEDPSL
jgi:hypothetical protein